MWILYLMVFSGLLGTALQWAIPAAIDREMPDEASLEQIPERIALLANEAGAIAADVRGPRAEFFGELYERSVAPYLASAGETGVMSSRTRAAHLFARYRSLLPDAVHPNLVELEAICEQARCLRGQQRMHSWLRGWLLVHVPLSGALVILIAVAFGASDSVLMAGGGRYFLRIFSRVSLAWRIWSGFLVWVITFSRACFARSGVGLPVFSRDFDGGNAGFTCERVVGEQWGDDFQGFDVVDIAQAA